MFYGLAHLESDFHADNLHKVVQLAPCFVTYLQPEQRTPEFANDGIMRYQGLGVYSINGPHWERNLATLCENFDAYTCYWNISITGDAGQGVQSEKYWTMNGIVDRFQEFATNWENGEYITDLVPIENIKQVPIAMFTATDDQTCP